MTESSLPRNETHTRIELTRFDIDRILHFGASTPPLGLDRDADNAIAVKVSAENVLEMPVQALGRCEEPKPKFAQPRFHLFVWLKEKCDWLAEAFLESVRPGCVGHR